jgi:rSAM/selenodomain-associated transferase 1
MTRRPTVVVLAKAPVPGRVKTRLCPPCSPREAAVLAFAALRDTLGAVGRVGGVRRVLALDGDPGDWVPTGFDVVAQPPGRLDERIAATLVATSGPTVLIGMDTPQVRATDIERALAVLGAGIDAVVGPARDGGYWLLGLRVPRPDAVLGVPMSVGHTGAAQIARLAERGSTVELLRKLRDVDTFDDALAVAADAPTTRFARAVQALRPTLAATSR